MSLLERLTHDYKEALKQRNEVKKSVLNFVLAKIKNKKIELQKDLEDADVIGILKKEVKEILEAIGFLEKVTEQSEGIPQGGTEKYQDELEIEKQKKLLLEFYLPATMNKEQTTELIEKLISDQNITDLKTQRGLLMKELMANYKGQVDGSLVNEIINEMIT